MNKMMLLKKVEQDVLDTLHSRDIRELDTEERKNIAENWSLTLRPRDFTAEFCSWCTPNKGEVKLNSYASLRKYGDSSRG